MINLYVVYSSIEDISLIKSRSAEIIKSLIDTIPQLSMYGYIKHPDELDENIEFAYETKLGSVILNTSGGTEAIINEITKRTSKPILIIADAKKNSFASALEAYASLKDEYAIKISYAEKLSEKVNAAKSFSTALSALNKINESHFGLIGEPSDWLLTSQKFTDFSPFKTKFTKIDINELTTIVNDIPVDDVSPFVDNWKSGYQEILVEHNSLIDSAKVYLALKKIIKQNKFDVLSVRCFDLLDYNYTACMGLSICNDEGITAGCEGDIPTTFTMMIAQYLSGQPVWMANPSSINKEKNQIIFAHCTVPSSFIADLTKAGLTTHMESGKSTAIRGPLRKETVTILRINSDFNRMTAVTGRIIETDMKELNLCRNQAVIQINSDVEKWVESTLGNHHVIVYGDIIPELKYFCDFADVELINL